MGVHIDEKFSGRDGVYRYRAQGAIYHKIGSLLPQSGNRPRYMQMCIFDTDHDIQNIMNENSLAQPKLPSILKQILDT